MKTSLIQKLGFTALGLGLSFAGLSQNCNPAFSIIDDPNSNQFVFVADSGANNSNVSYSWAINGSPIGGGSYAVWTGTSPGAYSICLSVIDSINNCSASACDSILVDNSNPTTICDASFYSYPDSSGGYYLVANQNNSSNAMLFWSVDGNMAGSGYTFQYTPNDSAMHMVCLEVVDSANNCSASNCDTINGIITPGCSAGFWYQQGPNGAYAFYPFNSDPGTSYTWTFSSMNSAPITSNEAAPIVVFTGNAVIDVCLTITNGNCTDYQCQPVYVQSDSNNIVYNGCNASFYSSVYGQDAYFSVTSNDPYFYPSYQGTITWNFGDGTVETHAFDYDAWWTAHQYASPGVYGVCMTITDSVSNCTNTICDTVVVGNTPSCDAYFVMFQDSTNLGTWYAYNLSYINSNSAQFIWNFGDGTTSTDAFPTHQYANPGHYTVCLTVVDSLNNCSDSYCDSSTVHRFTANSGMTTFNVINGVLGTKKEDAKVEITKVFPNPVVSEANIQFNAKKTQNVTVKMIDMLGQVVNVTNHTAQSGNNTLRIDTDNLNHGVYFVQIYDTNQTNIGSVKIVK